MHSRTQPFFSQEDYLSERNYEEPLDEDSAYRLLNFGDDYRNFIDSLSEGPNSCSERRNNNAGGKNNNANGERRQRRTRRFKVGRKIEPFKAPFVIELQQKYLLRHWWDPLPDDHILQNRWQRFCLDQFSIFLPKFQE